MAGLWGWTVRSIVRVGVALVFSAIGISLTALPIEAQPAEPAEPATTVPSTPPPSSIPDLQPPAEAQGPVSTQEKPGAIQVSGVLPDPIRVSTSGGDSATKTAVITGLVGGISAIVGVGLTQFGTFKLAKGQRISERTALQIDELSTRVNELDAAYAKYKDSEFGTSESLALDVATRNFNRAWRIIDSTEIHGRAERFHELLRKYTVEGDDLEAEDPATRQDVENASNALMEGMRSEWKKTI